MPKLSIVIPCYNEAENISILIDKLKSIHNNDIEIILVNNGSTDDTKNVLQKESLKNPKLFKTLHITQNIGYGYGIMSGIREALGDIISWTHADLQTDPADVINAYSAYIRKKNHYYCVLKGKRVGRNLFDVFFTFAMGMVSSYQLGVKLSDINAQPKMFHRNFLNYLTNTPSNFSLDLYLLYQARINSYEILEYPVDFGERLYGQAKGGDTLKGKFKLIKQTWLYIHELKENLID